MQPEIREIKHDGIRFHIKVWHPAGNAKGIIFLLHGLSDHSGRFAALAGKYCEAGYLFYAPDLRGNGKTQGRRGHFKNMAQMLDDVDALLADARQNFGNIPIVFHAQSMGGNIALNHLLLRPGGVKAAVVSSPWLRLTQPPSALKTLGGKILKILAPWLQQNNGLKATDLCQDKTITDSYQNDPLIHWKISLGAYFAIRNAGEYAIDHANQLQTPTLLLHSQSDPITAFAASEQFFRQSNQNIEFRSFNGLLHELHNETAKPEIVDGMIGWVKGNT